MYSFANCDLKRVTLKVAFFAVFSLLFLQASVTAVIHLDNTCVHGNQYIQLVGFACIAEEEYIRNPSYDGFWNDRGRYNIMAFTKINEKMNSIGINIGGVMHCSNFTVR